ncbi:unnamed protein product, partial [Ixodes persulcatus]
HVLYDAALEVLPVALAHLVPLGKDGTLGGAQLGLVGLAEAAPVDELRGEEELEQLLVLGQLVQPLVRLGAVQQVVLLVVVWGQHQEQQQLLQGLHSPHSTHLLALLGVLLHAVGAVQGRVVAADGQVRPLVLVQLNHQAVVAQLQTPVSPRSLAHLLFGVVKELGGDLLADDLGADVVLLGQAQPHLLQDQLHLLTLVHRPKRYLELLHDGGGLCHVSLRLLHLGQLVGQPGPLHLHIDL